MLLQAAKWAGVPPWELLEQPAGWLMGILAVMEVEGRVAKDVRGRRGSRRPAPG